tara:strand:- start:121 stop:348 length:228 start_codon:yes stop_codon:yes gene_type:complete
MSEYIKVKDHSNLVRDPQTDQIINTDHSEYNQYMARRSARRKAKEKNLSVEQDLASLKAEMGEIKSLLKELVNGN